MNRGLRLEHIKMGHRRISTSWGEDLRNYMDFVMIDLFVQMMYPKFFRRLRRW